MRRIRFEVIVGRSRVVDDRDTGCDISRRSPDVADASLSELSGSPATQPAKTSNLHHLLSSIAFVVVDPVYGWVILFFHEGECVNLAVGVDFRTSDISDYVVFLRYVAHLLAV